MPLQFADPADYDKVEPGDVLVIDGLLDAIKSSEKVKVRKPNGAFAFVAKLELSDRERDILLSGGLLNYTREKAHG